MIEASDLVLGWEVDAEMHPRYWMSPDAEAGSQPDGELAVIPGELSAASTIIVAQSGSGKSSFLGRIIEEILIRTRSRCVIIDPNSDFRRLHQTQGAKLWNEASYEPHLGRGHIPHERSLAEFRSRWRDVSITVSVGYSTRVQKPYSRLQLWWPGLGTDFLQAELNTLDGAEVFHCHSFVQAIAELGRLRQLADMDEVKVMSVAEEIYGSVKDIIGKPKWRASVLSEIQTIFPPEDLVEGIEKSGNLIAAVSAPAPRYAQREVLRQRLTALYDRAAASLDYFDQVVGRFYFGRVRELSAARMLADRPPDSLVVGPRVQVFDLPSIAERRLRLQTISSVLSLEWERARAEWRRSTARAYEEERRVPTFIVVDEAHHVIPKDPTDEMQKAIREQFRLIIAEGRKLGIFLILASQRPDKLDEQVIGECENKAIMRLTSARTLELTRDALALDDVPTDMLEKLLNVGIGRALIAGGWSKTPKIIYGAARRTVEGGRNLRSEYWAQPPN